ncbi:hypothetical protein JD77_04605 [Micromonospora olivasterospora]|uniref:Glutamate-cysteine ligase n=1 Tax=Micromonospora olivasterospora TaxID=1880 RepID=A0A562IFU1_MICOL|nr:hypothetical protein JD77_04605 [Micromonospora olivasterospora]
MGQDVGVRTFSREDRARYREKVRRCLDVFAEMLRESRFDVERPMTGLEIELNLVDEDSMPAMRNADVLTAIADPSFQTELGQFNVEINVTPRRLAGTGTAEFEEHVRASLNAAEAKAQDVGAHMVMIGILPTLRPEHLTAAALSANPRYELLNEQIFAARGEDLRISISGVERLAVTADTITPEAACTSTQFHLQVSPAQFADYWNAAQAIAGVQVALGANSPLFFGRELWRETRIPLFQQATDTRPEEIKAQGVRPRVWFGERWITTVFDLFEENVRYFPALLPVCDPEDPAEALARGDVPKLAELRLHNGTVYRWNRPVYDVLRAARTCGWRTGCCPPARRCSTRSPTAPSTSGWSGPWPSRTGRCGRRCRSAPPRRTSPAAPGTASTPRCSGRAWDTCRSPNWCCAGCCRWPTTDWTVGAWTRPSGTDCSASSSTAA